MLFSNSIEVYFLRLLTVKAALLTNSIVPDVTSVPPTKEYCPCSRVRVSPLLQLLDSQALTAYFRLSLSALFDYSCTSCMETHQEVIMRSLKIAWRCSTLRQEGDFIALN